MPVLLYLIPTEPHTHMYYYKMQLNYYNINSRLICIKVCLNMVQCLSQLKIFFNNKLIIKIKAFLSKISKFQLAYDKRQLFHYKAQDNRKFLWIGSMLKETYKSIYLMCMKELNDTISMQNMQHYLSQLFHKMYFEKIKINKMPR